MVDKYSAFLSEKFGVECNGYARPVLMDHGKWGLEVELIYGGSIYIEWPEWLPAFDTSEFVEEWPKCFKWAT